MPEPGHATRYAFWRVAVPLLQSLPPLRALAVARAASRVAPVRPRAAVRHAMGRAFPERSPAELDALAREEARFHLRERLEMAVFPRLDRAAVEAHVRLEGREHLEAALAAGRGVVLAGAHVGVHGLPPLALTLMGYPVHVRTFLLPEVELTPAQAYGQRQRRALEARLRVRYMRAGEGADDDPDAPLRAGAVLITTGDGLGPEQVLGEAPRVLPFLGLPTAWPDQAFRLAARHGAPVLGLFLGAEGPRHRLRITAPLGGPDPLADWVAAYETELRRAPAEWQFWDRFRDGALVRSAGWPEAGRALAGRG